FLIVIRKHIFDQRWYELIATSASPAVGKDREMPGIGCRLLAPLACLALIAAAPESPGPSLDSLFESADRGELAPIARALETSPDGDARALLQARLRAARLDPAAALD